VDLVSLRARHDNVLSIRRLVPLSAAVAAALSAGSEIVSASLQKTTVKVDIADRACSECIDRWEDWMLSSVLPDKQGSLRSPS
jgi:hypothetical protein